MSSLIPAGSVRVAQIFILDLLTFIIYFQVPPAAVTTCVSFLFLGSKVCCFRRQCSRITVARCLSGCLHAVSQRIGAGSSRE